MSEYPAEYTAWLDELREYVTKCRQAKIDSQAGGVDDDCTFQAVRYGEWQGATMALRIATKADALLRGADSDRRAWMMLANTYKKQAEAAKPTGGRLFRYLSSSSYDSEEFLIRAETLERAKEIAGAGPELPQDSLDGDWEELDSTECEGVLWTEYKSYDTGDRG